MDIKAIKRLNTLRELAGSYEYGQFNLLEGNFNISYFESADKFIFKNFFTGEYQSNKGTCRELTMKSFKDIKSHFPQLYVTRTHGQDDKFFNGEEGHHWFNIITDYDPQINKIISLEDKIKEFIQREALVFDPCFRTVKKFSQTKYKVIELFHEECQFDTTKDVHLDKYVAVPLVFDYKKNILACLHNQPKYDSKIGIYFMNLNNGEGYDMNSSQLNSMNNVTIKAHIKKFAEVFRHKIQNLEIQCPRKTAESLQ